jgi:hypothetical protein
MGKNTVFKENMNRKASDTKKPRKSQNTKDKHINDCPGKKSSQAFWLSCRVPRQPSTVDPTKDIVLDVDSRIDERLHLRKRSASQDMDESLILARHERKETRMV